MYRIIGADGREYGPISADQLCQWIAENRANGTTRVLVDGSTDWKTLGSLPEFSALFGSTPRAVTPSSPAPFLAQAAFGRTNNGLAITGLVLGILSVLTVVPCCCCCYGMPFNILGLIFSVIGLIQINTNPERFTGRGIAITGILLSIISLCFTVIWLILFGINDNWDQMRHHGYRL
jgi:Domain of unknown function (DUF4190)/GYF domain 2